LRRVRQNPEKYPWLTELLARRPFKVVAIALANRMARVAWALLARGAPIERQRKKRLSDAAASVRFMNCKGDDDADAKRSRPSIGKADLASLAGFASPPIIAFKMRRPLVPTMSEITDVSLMLAFSSVF
jgi:hypothetical protein